jgi:N-acetylmuramoyl-L-alanine amidase
MSNSDRAMIANTLKADLYISIHASNPNDASKGITVICQTKDNPYSLTNYSNSRLLADTLLGSLADKTGAESYKVLESDKLMGINWCTVPNAIVNVGNLNNQQDDEKLAEEDYQQKIAEGIVAGIDSYFSQK